VAILDESFTLANGVAIPRLGFGTWQIPDGAPAYDAVLCALRTGYRHIDTARAYGNEASVARALRDSGLDRASVFLTSKLPAEVKTEAGAREAFARTIEALGPAPLDLYLIHAPWPWSEIGKDCRAGNREVWKVMEGLYTEGRCRAIGVSNFSVADLTDLMAGAAVTPLVNQIRFFIGDTQEEVTRFCQERGILVEGYSPLATGKIVDNAQIAVVAQKYGVSVPQVCIRYVLQRGVLPLPKSTHPEFIRQNAAVDFTLAPEDMAYLDELTDTVGRRGGG
jgi:diketogulonate reductase-like aldo/keto reductase